MPLANAASLVNNKPVDANQLRRLEIASMLSLHRVDAAKERLLELVTLTGHWSDVWKLADTLLRSDGHCGMLAALRLVGKEHMQHAPLRLIVSTCLDRLSKECWSAWTREDTHGANSIDTGSFWPDMPTSYSSLNTPQEDGGEDLLAFLEQRLVRSTHNPQVLFAFPLKLAMHLACLFRQADIALLYPLAQSMVNTMPDSALAWFAVGLYYSLTGKHGDARRYLRKAAFEDDQEIAIHGLVQRVIVVHLLDAYCSGGDHEQAASIAHLLLTAEEVGVQERAHHRLLMAREQLHLRRPNVALKHFSPHNPNRGVLGTQVFAEYLLQMQDVHTAQQLLRSFSGSSSTSLTARLHTALQLLCGIAASQDSKRCTDAEIRQICFEYRLSLPPSLSDCNAGGNEPEEMELASD